MPPAFTKLLIARHSPQNGCFAPDGAILTVVPRARVPLRDNVAHEFRAAANSELTSKYGWVLDVPAFDLQKFADEYLGGRVLNKTEEEHLQTMFASISKLPADTPVAATYSSRGVEKKRMDFTVHRVILYKG